MVKPHKNLFSFLFLGDSPYDDHSDSRGKYSSKTAGFSLSLTRSVSDESHIERIDILKMHSTKKERDSYSSAPTYQKINTIFMSVLFSLSLSFLTHFSPSQNDKMSLESSSPPFTTHASSFMIHQ